MNRFLQTLQQSGYRQFYLAFGDGNLRYQDWRAGIKGASGPLLDLVKLFLLHESLPKKQAVALLGKEFLAEILECGVVQEKAGKVTSNAFLLMFCRSYAMFCQITVHPFAYFGADSVALATYQTPAPGGRVLDLCCGPGIQSFVASGTAAQVTGVEIRKETWRIAELNRRLNGLGSRVEFVCTSAEAFAKANEDKYDRILFNPPLVPVVPGYKFAFVGDGGADGLDVTRHILKNYHRRLTDGGSIEFVGLAPGRKGKLPGCQEIRNLARGHGLGGRIHILSQQAIRPATQLFEALAFDLARNNGLEMVRARKILEDHFKKLGVDVCWLFFASLGNAAGKKVATVDVSQSFLGEWFV